MKSLLLAFGNTCEILSLLWELYGMFLALQYDSFKPRERLAAKGLLPVLCKDPDRGSKQTVVFTVNALQNM